MTESRNDDGDFAPGHTEGPEIEGIVDQTDVAFQRHRTYIKREYPDAWEKYAVDAEGDR